MRKIVHIDMNGSKESEIPATFADGMLSLDIDTSKLKYGTPYFEIVFPQ